MIRYAMARGLLVVDENVNALAEELRNKNFRIIVPPMRTDDATIVEAYCAHRILITTNVDGFVELAPIYEFGIIEVTLDAMADLQGTASKISSEYSQRALRHSEPFLLKITPHSTTFRTLN